MFRYDVFRGTCDARAIIANWAGLQLTRHCYENGRSRYAHGNPREGWPAHKCQMFDDPSNVSWPGAPPISPPYCDLRKVKAIPQIDRSVG